MSKETYPILPLRDMVVYPYMIVPLFVGRQKSMSALDYTVKNNTKIVLATQLSANKENATSKDLYKVGVLAEILQLTTLGDGTIRVLVKGLKRVQILDYTENKEFLEAETEELEEFTDNTSGIVELSSSLLQTFADYNKTSKKVSTEVFNAIKQIDTPSKVADTIASHLTIQISEKQAILEVTNVAERISRLKALIEAEISVIELDKKVQTRVKKQMEKNQRDYYLNEQLKAIQNELEESEDGNNEFDEIRNKIKKLALPKEAKDKCNAELKKLKSMNPISAEASVVRNYLDWLLTLPWGNSKLPTINMKKAIDVLDEDHYGLEKIKDRVLEYLAVQKRSKKPKGSILCFVGAPGVGKTSLGRSIAKAANREFVRMSLGGVRDEAEIRGHRRTYIGAMPGKIIQNMKKVGVTNPLMLLDEIDKMSSDFRGDPAAALLEVLDPEQNSTFVDHYIEVEYDLSNVMFVATANSMDIPEALLDRMEIINLSGYTEEEKAEIAKRHLIKKQYEDKNIKDDEINIDESVVTDLIRYYTRESGVRGLSRELDNLVRKAVRKIEDGTKAPIKITSKNLEDFAGVRKFKVGMSEEKPISGLVTGLAWTRVGGEILSIEAVKVPGKGRIKFTGKLGDVMKESIQAALSLVHSRSNILGISNKVFDEVDIHVHVPEGATPKDGPSAGIAMATCIVSVLTGIPVRNDVAMTGEVTLLGRVLAIGGLKEKLLAALRANIKTVIIPKENEKDLRDMPQSVLKGLKIVPVKYIDEVFSVALSESIQPITENKVDSGINKGNVKGKSKNNEAYL